MKKSEIIKELGFIDPEFITEAANFRAHRMNPVKIVALAACIAIIVTAVPVTLILNRDSPNENHPALTTPVVVENKDPDKDVVLDPLNVIYCSADSIAKKEESIRKALLDKETRIKEFRPLYYDFSVVDETLEYSSDIPEKLTFTLGNKTYSCTFDSVYNCNSIRSTNETMKSYAKIAKYTMDTTSDVVAEVNPNVYYRVDTKEILGAWVPNEVQLSKKTGNITEEDIKTIAIKDLSNLYGKSFLSKYDMTIKKISYKIFNNTINIQQYLVTLKRNVGDFSTYESVELCYNTEGEFIYLQSNFLGIVDALYNNLNEKMLITEEANALKLLDGKLVERQFLLIGNDGYLYMDYKVKYVEDDILKGECLYYKINNK